MAPMNNNKKIRVATGFGVGFILVAAFKQIVTPGLHQLQPASYTAFYAYFAVFALLMILFFGTYLFAIRGYLHLASKYHIRGLKTATWILMGAIAAVCIAILIGAFQLDLNMNATITNDVAAAALGVYMIEPFVVGFFSMRLKEKLGRSAFAPVVVGAISALYGIYSYGLPMFGYQPIAILGNFVFIPIPEAAFVIASILLFQKAAQDR
jgi:hypothetical protein